MEKRSIGTPSILASIGRILGFAALACLFFFVASIVAFSAERAGDASAQKARLAALRASPPAASASLAADLALSNDASLDRLRLLATHNSYRRASGPVRLFYIGLVEPQWPAKLAYSNPPLTDQLNSGLRSFELDVRVRGSGFVLAHVPLVDDRSYAPDFPLALEELALWSERNPGHAPIILLLELVEDYSFLDPALRPWDGPALDRLDAALRSGLGARLLEPDELRGNATSLAAALSKGWPKIGAVRGRFLVILHKNEAFRALYTAGHPSLEGRAMLDCAPPLSPDAFADVLNDPVADAPAIRAESASGILVRTRADADLVYGPALLAAALASGARIVSTDFPPGRPATDGYVASLPGGRTMDLLPLRP
jgi:hypothetical protein